MDNRPHSLVAAGDALQTHIVRAAVALCRDDREELARLLNPRACTELDRTLSAWSVAQGPRDLLEAGDRIWGLVRRAQAAHAKGDLVRLWTILDQESYPLLREWDRLRGRSVVTDREIEEGLRPLMADLRRAMNDSGVARAQAAIQ